MTKAKEKIEEEIKDLAGEQAELVETPAEAEDKAEKPVKTISKEKKFLTLKQTGEQNWYVIHTYSGYEEQVAESLNQRIESMNMQDKVFDIIVPKEKQIEIKNGKRKIIERKIFPGYVFVNMIVTDDSWYVVRNTPNVTGFIGFGVRPTPVSKEEIDRIKKRMGVEEPKYQIDLRVQDLVKITDGALKGFEGKIEEVDQGKGKLKVLVNMFGRETPVNLDFLQVKKV
jgi:transcriptional antiterminator NusG